MARSFREQLLGGRCCKQRSELFVNTGPSELTQCRSINTAVPSRVTGLNEKTCH